MICLVVSLGAVEEEGRWLLLGQRGQRGSICRTKLKLILRKFKKVLPKCESEKAMFACTVLVQVGSKRIKTVCKPVSTW